MTEHLLNIFVPCFIDISGGSRIPCWGARSCWEGANLRRGLFLVKMYAKKKELDPIGGGAGLAPLDPPMDIADKLTFR